ncbi:diacylglycerol kinase family protein [Anaerorhabdus furcosa]|uniref:Diacylglycerol kinase (ATP) n=1 Tax=Anaerorhabdus furcosa TaxID=118967 RepID=A0A1T4N6Q4_9FIRM|nr:diacylglycerol kinase family protein [Anaerorhabdus furcosa]SJZ74851.1 diacylglycerol kinase (ATP) [Anaerorhabdus furcosa]
MNKFKVAFSGLAEALSHRSVLIQFIFMIGAVIVAFVLKFTMMEWLILGLCCGLVISIEMINTCIEKVCDFCSTETDPRIKSIKDMSAGAVLFSASISLIIGIVMVLNHIGG